MSLFNALYTLGQGRISQPIQANSKIKIELDNPNGCEQLTRWAKWIVSLPVQFTHGFFNTAYMKIAKDISRVVSSQVYSGNSINRLQFLWGKSGHVITSPKVISALTKPHRHAEEGVFERDREDPFFPILRDLYPNEKSLNQDDFLLTCAKDHVNAFRDPILKYLGSNALPFLRPLIDEVTDEVLNSLCDGDAISAKDLAETYSVSILARLFLNHKGTLDDFQKIGRAASRAAEFQYLKKWGTPDAEQLQNYENDLQTLRDALECNDSDFVNSLSHLSPLQIKGELLLTYIGGSETTSSVMQYVLWRLGQNAQLQDEIRNQPKSVTPFIDECLSEYTPVTFFSRFARQDLVISVQNWDGTNWSYPIAKGDAILMAPLLAKSSIFGGGVHSCPGQWLARAELCSMVTKLVTRYEITSTPKKDKLATIPGFGFLKVEPVDLALLKREQNS